MLLPHSLHQVWKDLENVFWAPAVIEALPLTCLAACPVWLLLFGPPVERDHRFLPEAELGLRYQPKEALAFLFSHQT